VDPNGTNPNSIYTDSMGSDARGGISFTSGNTAGSKYAARTNMGDKPVNFVSWWDAARVANWLHNGQGSGSTETGAYTLNNATFGETPAVNAGANFYIPTQDQWYKAACYKGGSTNAGYWDYATQSDTAPTAVSATVVGTGSSGGVSPVITGNFANYKRGVTWNGRTANVTNRGLRGGRLDGIALYLQSSSAAKMGTTNETNNAGFRLASPVAVPEPSTWVMGLAGIACGGLGMLRRRKRA
jgi:hypothetical protein